MDPTNKYYMMGICWPTPFNPTIATKQLLIQNKKAGWTVLRRKTIESRFRKKLSASDPTLSKIQDKN